MALYLLKPLIWNTKGYERPAGVRTSSGFPHDFGYGHEEWNNSPKMLLKEADGCTYRVFHTERVGRAPVAENASQTFVFMTASHDGIQQLVGVAGGATCLVPLPDGADSHRCERDRLVKKLSLHALWKDAWTLARTPRLYQSDETRFLESWKEQLHWLPNWVCPAELYWWPSEPVTLQVGKLTTKKALAKRFQSYQALDIGACERIMEMVPNAQRDAGWHRLVDAMRIAPTQQDGSDDTPRNLPITTVLALRQARIGQGKFRADLIQRWGGACSVTGWDRTELLWAAHVKPWSRATTVEKLDPDNGLLLSRPTQATRP